MSPWPFFLNNKAGRVKYIVCGIFHYIINLSVSSDITKNLNNILKFSKVHVKQCLNTKFSD